MAEFNQAVAVNGALTTTSFVTANVTDPDGTVIAGDIPAAGTSTPGQVLTDQVSTVVVLTTPATYQRGLIVTASEIQFPESGLYLVVLYLNFDADAAGRWSVTLNGSNGEFYFAASSALTNDNANALTLTGLFNLSANDTVTARAFQSTGMSGSLIVGRIAASRLGTAV